MSVLLIVVGAIIAVLGLGMAGYGIPVKEFSFGNTLILAGAATTLGGLIILAIGALVGQLQRIAEMLATRTPLQAGQQAGAFEPSSVPHAVPPPPIPFPARPKPASADILGPPPGPTTAANYPLAAPKLLNPEAPVSLVEQFEVPVHEDVPLSPPPMPAPAALSESEPLPPPPPPPPTAPRPDTIFPPPLEHHPAPPPAFTDESWPSAPAPPRMERSPQTSYFDTMWPADTPGQKRPAPEGAPPEPNSEPPMPPAEASSEPVAILKSGVVDGMAYTLYVDGSIEAELPHGTLRFASINELRDHLAKGT